MARRFRPAIVVFPRCLGGEPGTKVGVRAEVPAAGAGYGRSLPTSSSASPILVVAVVILVAAAAVVEARRRSRRSICRRRWSFGIYLYSWGDAIATRLRRQGGETTNKREGGCARQASLGYYRGDHVCTVSNTHTFIVFSRVSLALRTELEGFSPFDDNSPPPLVVCLG